MGFIMTAPTPTAEELAELRRHYAKGFGPAEVGEVTGIGPDTQRDWRRRGLIDGLGEQDARGRWRYSGLDCLTLWIARRLLDAGFSAGAVLEVSEVAAGKLIRAEDTFIAMRKMELLVERHLALKGDGTMVTRYMVLYRDKGEWGFNETDDLSQLFKTGWPVAHVVDLWHLAKTAPKELVAKIFPDAA